MGTGSGSPAPVGKYRPGNFKPQVWEYSPRVRGCALQSGAVGRTSQRLHPQGHRCCPHSVRYYTWQMQSCEREKKMLFFPLTNTQVRVSHCSEVQQINFTCLTECRSAFCCCWRGDRLCFLWGKALGAGAGGSEQQHLGEPCRHHLKPSKPLTTRFRKRHRNRSALTDDKTQHRGGRFSLTPPSSYRSGVALFLLLQSGRLSGRKL